MIKWIFSGVVFLLLLGLTAFAGFYLAVFLIGPHSDILPDFFQAPVSLIILAGVLVIPFLVAKKAYFFLKKQSNVGE